MKHRPFYPYLGSCMGKGEPSERCPCPPLAKQICAAVTLRDEFRPRVIGRDPGEPYTPVRNCLLAHVWGFGPLEPSAEVKMTYLFLVALAGTGRLVYARPEKLAQLAGLPLKTYKAHVRALERIGLLLQVRKRDLCAGRKERHKVVLLLDLPLDLKMPGGGFDLAALRERVFALGNVVHVYLARDLDQYLDSGRWQPSPPEGGADGAAGDTDGSGDACEETDDDNPAGDAEADEGDGA